MKYYFIVNGMEYKEILLKKRQLDNKGPLPSELLHNLDEWFRIELTFSSNAIEGNTLTRQETALVVEKGITVGGKSLKEHLEATNHAKAIDWIKKSSKHKISSITEKDILDIHAIILDGIDNSNSGFYRRVPVRISGSRVILPNPLKVPVLMKEFIKWLKESKKLNPIELAAEAHYRLVTIHPFIDGNGRTARLLMNWILLMQGYPIAIIKKKDRLAYINSLEKAQLGGSKNDYLDLIYIAVNSSLDIYLEALTGKKTKAISEKKEFKIGQLAKKVNESISTIRFWTKCGLLDVSQVTSSGYQLYDSSMIKRIEKIKELKTKRYTLEEIKNKLHLI
ncbi:MAG: Adenosine monophosphate-protein transferase and cysteine protease IbpA [Candidatus Anoxychlamydiales bacterium]|nr:Adenosine monophosphate-protein transferase and cysteine protease IbpA [Candidatus Anoxychlamydiales bacterium]NGX51983.1 Adenosine monophosphate-protein transferase and cysteine protease IbpA [Candidatus Anoxychlamydiales bacterium]